VRVVPRLELGFAALYSLLILLAGLGGWVASGRPLPLAASLALLAVYLPLALRRPLRRRRAARAPFPEPWRRWLQESSPYYRALDPEGRLDFERDVRLVLAETRIAAAGGAAAGERTRLLIAAGVATMLHGRPDWEPPLRDGVTVYPGFAFDKNYRPGRGNIAGQAPAGGPLLVAEKSLWQGFAGEGDGVNVVFHELAHYLDFEARRGGMRVASDQARPVPWAEAIAQAYERHDFSRSPLPAYASQNEAEFFACASELFFENPRRLSAASPRLYSLLAEFYGQDPALLPAPPPA